ncbi:SRPBCC family protein [Streptomyces sp. TS71-3]|uniref:SRPBCC family protein n=1 Tax=Streptomyces sp. TS71-3 TaxID=2733862 RepID=UPI001B00A2CF|nr:SRPBCC family protein [Streptomyces sp. TS71-3]GHJ37820.1 cyclase [Streptomyces sp. TS71-3]
MADTRSQQTTSALGRITSGPAADRLKSEVQDYLGAQAERLLSAAGHRLGQSTARLTDIAEGNGPGLGKLAAEGGKKLIGGKNPLGAVGGGLKDTVKGVLPGGGKDGKKDKKAQGKPTVILESVDVGVPLRTAYDQWTQYQEFSSFAKGVQDADVSDEDVESDWQFKIFLSNRANKATTTEQIPDERIAWTTEAAQGTTKGVVTFHELGPNLTRLLLIMEYYPVGFVEKTGNLWHAQGRRARLDFKNFARFISMTGEASGAWRGEIRDSEVVRSHEDAVAEEEDGEPSEAEDVQPGDEYEDEADYGYEQEEPDGSGNSADDEYPEDEAAEYEEDEGYETADYADQDGNPDEEAAADERPAGRRGSAARSRR